MRIKITQFDNPGFGGVGMLPVLYRAELMDVDDGPPIGEGRSQAEAVGSLIFNAKAEECSWPPGDWPAIHIDDLT